MKTNVDQDLAEVVKQLAHNYARRWWWADEEDLRQVGWVVALSVRAKFDAAKCRTGTIKPLARLAIKRHYSRYLCANTSPVSASDHKRYELIGLERAPLEAITEMNAVTPEVQLEVERWRALVRVRLRGVVDDDTAVESLLSGEHPTPEAIVALGRIMESPELHELWKERTE